MTLSQIRTFFSVRIVSIDYYMSPPIPDMDICYSSFQGLALFIRAVCRYIASTTARSNLSYYPHDVSRAANLLLGGAILDKVLQPMNHIFIFFSSFWLIITYTGWGMYICQR